MKTIKFSEDFEEQKVLCPFCNKPVHISEAVIETEKGTKGLKISHIKCRIKEGQKRQMEKEIMTSEFTIKLQKEEDIKELCALLDKWHKQMESKR